MKFLIDASTDRRLREHLLAMGHDVSRIGTDHPATLSDSDVLAIAHREGRILITDDRDFGELVFRHRRPHAGVIYLRLGTTHLATLLDRIDDVLMHHAARLDQFLVVTRDTVRFGQGE